MKLILRLEQDLVVGGVRNCAPGGESGRSRAASATQDEIDRVAMNERATPAPAGGEALGQHPDDGVEVATSERAERPGAPQPVVERGFRPILRRDFGDNLLGEHVKRPVGDLKPVKLPAANAVDQGRAFDEVVAREWKQSSLGRPVDGVAGPSDPLQEGRDRTWGTDLANEVDVADVDPEFERGSRDQRPQVAAFQPLLGREF